VRQYGIEVALPDRVADLHNEPLNKDTVDAVVTHPLEMPSHRLSVERTEDMSDTSVGMTKWGGVPFGSGELRQIRPEIDVTASRLETVPALPVVKAPVCAIPLGGKPPLVSTHHFSMKSIPTYHRVTVAYPH